MTGTEGVASPAAATTLFEREREVGVLQAALRRAVQGEGGVVVVDGPPGIGKSRLLAELRGVAADGGARVLTARCSELERAFPFGVARQLFEPALADPDVRERWLAGAAVGSRPVFDAPGAGDDAGAGDASFGVLHGLHWLVVNATADGPLLLAVDDLHWCDPPSLRFLAYLARRLEGLPVLVAVTVRTGDPGADAALVAEVAGDPASESVRPGPLTGEAAANLVRARLGADADPEFCDACHAATKGNPLLLRQLLTALEADSVRPEAASVALVREIGPRAASRGVLLRLARLPPDAIPVARAVAVLGEQAELPAVAAFTELDERRVAEAIAALARAEILRPDPLLGFVHPLVRDAVYRDLQPGERELAHARAATLLVESGAPADEVASHLLEVPRRGEHWIAELLLSAARTAVRRGAPESAVAYLRRALDEPPPAELRAQILFELGVAETNTSGPDAEEHLTMAYRELEDPTARALAAFILARTELFTGRTEEARALVRRVVDDLPDGLEDVRDGLRAVDAIALYFGTVRLAPGETLDRLAAYRTLPPDAGIGKKLLGAVASLDWMVAAGPAEDAADLADAVLADGALFRSDPGLFWVSPLYVLTLADRPIVMDHWEEIRAIAHRGGSPFTVLTISLWRGWTLAIHGELAEGEESLRDAVEQIRHWGTITPSILLYPRAFLALTLLDRGNAAGARAALPAAPVDDGSDGANHARHAEIAVLLAEGRAAEALEATHGLERHLAHVRNPAWGPWRSLRARSLHGLGAGRRRSSSRARSWRSPGNGARRAWSGASSGFSGSWRRTMASSIWRRRSPCSSARPRAWSWRGRWARSDLYASGARPRRTAMQGVEALSAREQRVATLAAEGNTNKDIAQALYVTPKTVEVHLGSAYRKLGIRSRRELPGALVAKEAR